MTEETTPTVVPLSADWPGRPLPFMPGDLSRYVPHGMAFGVGPIIQPWDDPIEALKVPNYYGLEAVQSDPVRAAPTQYAEGGVIYFGDRPWERLKVVFDIMRVRLDNHDYAVFESRAADPMADRYLEQVRIASTGALGHLFGVGEELAQIAKQSIPVGEYIQQFMAEQSQKWEDGMPGYCFSGSFGGDGDWAKERLCFGFMVENGCWGVYRLWSRAWLITK